MIIGPANGANKYGGKAAGRLVAVFADTRVHAPEPAVRSRQTKISIKTNVYKIIVTDSVHHSITERVKTTLTQRAAILIWFCTMALPLTAAAEGQWIDLFPLVGKSILLGLPLEIAQFCYNLWPLMVGLAVLSWAIRGFLIRKGWAARVDAGLGWGSRSAGLLGIVLRPWLITSLAVFVVLVAMVARVALKPEQLQSKRFSLSRLGQAFVPLPKPEPRRPVIPFALADGRAWPKVATEFNETGSQSAEYAGQYALEIENGTYQGGVFAKLCDDSEAPGCPAIRTMFIPRGSSITVKALAGGSYRLYYRLVDDVSKAAQSRPFSLPGKTSFYSVYSGAGVVPKTPVVGNGTFEHGSDQQAALIKLPLSTVSMEFNPKNALFKLIQAEAF